jgi:hypothetical protein
MKPFGEIWKFAVGREDPEPPPAPPAPPTPYEIALKFAGDLLASGRFGDDPGAAMDTAWSLVIPFYQGQLAYVRQVGILSHLTEGRMSAAEGDMSAEEARAYVAGEANPAEPLASLRPITVAPAAQG